MVTLAVIPILVTGGAAVLPAIIAAMAGFVALLFRPKELFQFIKRKPWVPLVFVAVGAGIYALVLLFPTRQDTTAGFHTAVRATAQTQTSQTDWTRVSLEIIAAKERARRQQLIVSAEGTTPELTQDTSMNMPLIFRGDAARRGGAGSSPRGLSLVWNYQITNAMFLSSPLVHNRRVYATYTFLDPPQSFGGVVCIDAETGREIWISETKDKEGKKDFQGFFSSPALSADGRNLLVGQGLHYDANSELVCLDADTGQVRWLNPTPLHVESSPAIEADTVVVGAGAIEDSVTRLPKGHAGYVFATRISDGEQIWKYDLADPESSPVVLDGIAYIGSGFNGNAIVALRIESDEELQKLGKERLVWRAETPHPATGAVTAFGDYVFIGVGNGDFVFADPNPEGYVIAWDRHSGKELWRARQPDAVLAPIAVWKDSLVVPVRNGELALIKMNDGSEVWRTKISRSPVLTGAAATDDLLYVCTAEGYLHVVNPINGRVEEKIFLNSPTRPGELGLTISSPWVVGDMVFVGSETGGLRAYRGATQR